MPRLRRSDTSAPGLRRVRQGRGFRYLAADGGAADPADVTRIRALVIPPAWTDVWVCPYPNGHLQATGLDAAGRRQYLYHEAWRARRDREKHDHVLEFAARLPAAREWAQRPAGRRGLGRDRVLAAAFTLLDVGGFRVGSDRYAEENGSYGLMTLRREHVRCERGRLTFDYPAKSGRESVTVVTVAACPRRGLRTAPPPPARRAAGLVRARAVARSRQRRRERLPVRSARRGRQRQGFPDLAGHRAGGRRPGRFGPAAVSARPQAGGQPGRGRGRGLPRNTPAVCRRSDIDPRPSTATCTARRSLSLWTSSAAACRPAGLRPTARSRPPCSATWPVSVVPPGPARPAAYRISQDPRRRQLAEPAGAARAGEHDLDRPAGLADLERGLRRGGRAAGHRTVGEPEHAAVPRAGQAAAVQVLVKQPYAGQFPGQRPGHVAAPVGQHVNLAAGPDGHDRDLPHNLADRLALG